MTRRLHADYAGAFVHVTSRGANRQAIYHDDLDRNGWLKLFARVAGEQRWTCHAYCLMTNHFHLLFELAEATLARGMHRLNGAYAQRFNERHDHTGHVFEGPYRVVDVVDEGHLHEVSRYIALNPVRARMVRRPEEWPWSSYRATAGVARPPVFLTVDLVHELCGGPAGYTHFVGEADMSTGLAGRHVL